jgi:hypothetical protein
MVNVNFNSFIYLIMFIYLNVRVRIEKVNKIFMFSHRGLNFMFLFFMSLGIRSFCSIQINLSRLGCEFFEFCE